MNTSCIFCKIVNGDLPASKVLETPDVIAFMDINPVTRGHVLVIPRAHHDPITDVPDDLLAKVIAAAKRIAAAQFRGLKADGVNITQANGEIAGQIINHVHFHVIPRYGMDEQPKNWVPGKYASPAEMETFSVRIKEALKQND